MNHIKSFLPFLLPRLTTTLLFSVVWMLGGNVHSAPMPEALQFLRDVKVTKFECLEMAPDKALLELVSSLKPAESERVLKVLLIESFEKSETLAERMERYKPVSLVADGKSLLECIDLICRMTFWHFDFSGENLVVRDWHRGNPGF